MISLFKAAIVLTIACAAPGMARVVGAAGPADPDRESDEKSRASLVEHLARIPGGGRGRIQAVTGDAASRAFPSYRFYAVRYRDYPMKPPAPMKSSNLFAVPAEVPVKHLADMKALEDFFRSTLAPVKDDAAARLAVKAWLELAQELHQDGFYKFTTPEDSLVVRAEGGRRVASGKAVASEGGKGEIAATLTFGPDGKLISVEPSGKVQPSGPRPA